MARIVIDGYNLMGTGWSDLEAEREQLVDTLIQYARNTGHDLTLVFDGYLEGGHESSEVRGGIRITYTGGGEKADAAIIRILPRGVESVVVSSDREVQAGAWAANAVAIDSETFWKKMHAAVPVSTAPVGSGHEGSRHEEAGSMADMSMYDGGAELDPDEQYEETYARGSKKGNPRKSSKRRKAQDRILRKL